MTSQDSLLADPVPGERCGGNGCDTGGHGGAIPLLGDLAEVLDASNSQQSRHEDKRPERSNETNHHKEGNGEPEPGTDRHRQIALIADADRRTCRRGPLRRRATTDRIRPTRHPRRVGADRDARRLASRRIGDNRIGCRSGPGTIIGPRRLGDSGLRCIKRFVLPAQLSCRIGRAGCRLRRIGGTPSQSARGFVDAVALLPHR